MGARRTMVAVLAAGSLVAACSAPADPLGPGSSAPPTSGTPTPTPTQSLTPTATPTTPAPTPTEAELPDSLPGQVLLPAFTDRARTYGGVSTGGRSGAITTSAYLYRWARPTEPLRLDYADIQELGGASDVYATSLRWDDTYTTAQLVRIDLRDGTVVRREVLSPEGWVVRGADAGGWVVEQTGDGSPRATFYVPLDTTLEPVTMDGVLAPYAVGSAGVVHASGGRLLLTPTDGGPGTELAELPRGAEGDLAVSMSDGVVAWWVGAAHELSYQVLGSGRTVTTPVPTELSYLQVAAVRGAVGVVQDQSTLWIWRPGRGFPPRPTSLGRGLAVGQSGAMPASLRDGSPAFVVDTSGGDAVPQTWRLVDVSGRVAYIDPGVRAAASVTALTASTGRVLVTYPIGPYVELGGESGRYYETVVAYDLTPSTPRRLFQEDLVPSASHPQSTSSGRRSAVVDVAVARRGVDVRLRLRDGRTGVRTIRLRGDDVSGLAMSGFYTAVAGGWRGSGRLPAVVLGRSGVVLATLPRGTTLVAQDGPMTAYVRGDGQLWVRDVSAKVGAGNPYRLGMVEGCERDCSAALAIAAGRVVVGMPGRDEGGPDVIRVYTLGSTSEPLEITTPYASTEHLAVSGDLLLVDDWKGGQILSLDLSSGSTELIPRLRASEDWYLAIAGDTLVWCPAGALPGCTRPATAPIPGSWRA